MNYSTCSNIEEWTSFENKQFENALAEIDPSSPNLFENIRARLPWKTVEQIMNHYEKLVEDVLTIERGGEFGSLKYAKNNVVDEGDNRNRRGAPWTDGEHRSFLIGLDKLGKGEWRNIAKYYVPTKSASQVASHGQKYFRRVKCGTPLKKRRYSIHDIRILNSTIVETSARNPSRHSFISHIPRNNDLPNADEKVIVGQHFNASASSVQVIAAISTDADNNTAPATLTSNSGNSSSNSSNSYSDMIMGYDDKANNKDYAAHSATNNTIFSTAPWFAEEGRGMSFYFPN